MNFFKDLKDEMENGAGDLSSEGNILDSLTDEDGFEDFDLSGEDALGIEEELLAKMQLEEELFGEPAVEEEKVVVEAKEAASEEPKKEESKKKKEEPKKEESKKEEGKKEEVKVEEKPVLQAEPMSEPDLPVIEGEANPDKVTVISKGTVINGSIISDGSLEVLGTVNGDINCLGKLTISGAVKGKSNASEVYVNSHKIDGGIVSKGSVKVSAGTIVIGDISASSCVVAGAVKGDLDVNGPVIIDSTAVVKGNVSAKGIQVNNGAVIDGFCALPYSPVDIDSYFEDEEEV